MAETLGSLVEDTIRAVAAVGCARCHCPVVWQCIVALPPISPSISRWCCVVILFVLIAVFCLFFVYMRVCVRPYIFSFCLVTIAHIYVQVSSVECEDTKAMHEEPFHVLLYRGGGSSSELGGRDCLYLAEPRPPPRRRGSARLIRTRTH